MAHVKEVFETIVLLACLTFVAYRGYKCLQKYYKHPQNTQVKDSPSQNEPFPSISICPTPFLKTDILQQCNLTYENYQFDNIWVGEGYENCTNPKLLQEMATTQFQDLDLQSIEFYFFDNQVTRWYENFFEMNPFCNCTLHWKRFPILQGVCQTLNIPQELISKGIEEIGFVFRTGQKSMNIFVHKSGEILSDVPKKNKPISFKTFMAKQTEIDHEVHINVELFGRECNNEPNYDFDECIHEYIHEKTMEIIGCTSVWGTNLDNICIDPVFGKKAETQFLNIYHKRFDIEKCPHPCTYFSISEKSTTHYNVGSYWSVTFNKYIKVYGSRYSYTELELLGEFGGYVGLFLGVSVFHITFVMEKIISQIRILARSYLDSK